MSIINQRVSNQPARSGHIGGIDSGNINPLYVEEYGDEVEHRFLKDSIMRKYFKFKTVRGTDTVTNTRIGSTSLQKVTRGVRPGDQSPTFDNISVKVDTMVLARANQFHLDAFLESIDTRKEIGVEHGREIGKFFDESILIQGIKASQVTNIDPDGTAIGGWSDVVGGAGSNNPDPIVRTAPKDYKGGTCVVLDAADDELDPDALELGIQAMCQNIEEKDIDINEATLFVRPAQYYVLLRNDKLMNRDFSDGNGDYAKGEVVHSCGIRIEKTNRFTDAPHANGVHHFLSNAGNNFAYDVEQADANCVALILMPKALLGGETIPLTSKVHYSDIELQWFIDSYLAYAVTPNRAEHAAGLYRFNPADA